jgi:hypothetical protein
MLIATFADLATPTNITSDPALVAIIAEYAKRQGVMELIARQQLLNYTIEGTGAAAREQYTIERKLKRRIAIYPTSGQRTEYVFKVLRLRLRLCRP